MQALLDRLAEKLNQPPFFANAQGKYHLIVDGHSIFLTQRSGELLLSTPLAVYQGDSHQELQPAVLRALLQLVVAWGRDFPQALVLDELGNLQLEARLGLHNLDEMTFEFILNQQITLLEKLIPRLKEVAIATQWRQLVWLP